MSDNPWTDFETTKPEEEGPYLTLDEEGVPSVCYWTLTQDCWVWMAEDGYMVDDIALWCPIPKVHADT